MGHLPHRSATDKSNAQRFHDLEKTPQWRWSSLVVAPVGIGTRLSFARATGAIGRISPAASSSSRKQLPLEDIHISFEKKDMKAPL
jgi:hypothetical protein